MKKYKEYMREGITLSKVCLRKNGFFKYYIYYFLSLFLSLTLFLEPFAGVSKYELKNQIKQNKGMTISTLFRGTDDGRYSKLLVANILKTFIFLGVIIVIGIAGFLLYLLGFGVVNAANFKTQVAIYFTIPAMIVLAIFLIIIPYICGPNAYLINRFKHLTSTGILYNSFNTFKEGGRKVAFLIDLTTMLPKLILIAIAYFASYGIGRALNAPKNPGYGIFLIIIFIFAIIYLLIAPLLSLIHRIAKTELYDDIICDRYFDDIHATNPNDNIRRIKILKHNKQKSYKLLFDDSNRYMDMPSYINSLNEIKEEKEEKIEANDEDIVEDKEDTVADILKDMENEEINKESLTTKPQIKDPIAPSTLSLEEKEDKIIDSDIDNLELDNNQEEIEEDEVLDKEDGIQESANDEVVEESQASKIVEESQEVTEEPQYEKEEIIDDEEQVIYVDEDGNEIPADEIEFVEEEVEDESLVSNEVDDFDEYVKNEIKEKEEKADEVVLEEEQEEKTKTRKPRTTKKSADAEAKPKTRSTTKKKKDE